MVDIDQILLKIPAYYREIIANLMYYIRFVLYCFVLLGYVWFRWFGFALFPVVFADFS